MPTQTRSIGTPPAQVTPGKTPATGKEMLGSVRTWTMVGLTAVFVVLYVLSLMGWLPGGGTVDQRLLRLEPILFAIIGYFFGQVPAERTEKTLAAQGEQDRRARDAARAAVGAETVRAERAETRIADARSVLTVARGAGDTLGGGEESSAVAAALRILA